MNAMRRAGMLYLLMLAACGPEAPDAAVEVKLELTGGANPGTYLARSAQAGCTQDVTGPGSWSVQLTDWSGAKDGLRSLQLMLPSRAAPEQFYLGLVFGDFFTGTVHEIETRDRAVERHGAGRAMVIKDRTSDIAVEKGWTKDSVAIVATITCRDRQNPGKGRTP